MIRNLFLSLLCVSLAACATTTRIDPIGEGGDDLKASYDEQKIWDRADRLEKYINSTKLVHEAPELEAYLDSVAHKLVSNMASTQINVRVKVLLQPLPNAFALPNGAVYVNSGLLVLFESESQLATLLGHEITHFTHRHALKQHRNATRPRPLVAVLQVLLATAGALSGDPAVVQQMGQLGGELGSLWAMTSVYGYSRELESEADDVGFRVLQDAGYDVSQAPHLFEILMDEASTNEVSFYFSTHPKLKERLESYQSLLQTQGIAQTSTPDRESQLAYYEKIDDLLFESIELDIKYNRAEHARKTIDRYVKYHPESPDAHFYNGEVIREEEGYDAAEDALKAYQKALDMDADHAGAHKGMGFLYRYLGKTKLAKKHFDRYVEISPDAIDVGIIRGYLEEE